MSTASYNDIILSMETQANITRPKFNAGFFFVSLGVLITLITSVVSLLHLVFETLNKRFPDVLNSSYAYGYSTYEYEGIRTALSVLIIFFPIYLLLSYFWNKLYMKHAAVWDELFRKWVMYIVLFLSSIVVAVDLVTLVRYFISGEITIRFVLKVVSTLIIAGLVGLYYVSVLKEKDNSAKKFSSGVILSILGALIVMFSIAYSFAILGSPMKQRQLRLDERRLGDLQNLQYQVINYWQQKEKLPATLQEMADPISSYNLPVDPEFEKGKQYEYALKGPLSFELCATFSQPMPKGWREYGSGPVMPYYGRDVAVSMPYPAGGGINESWDHGAGRTCFERKIDKDLYPPYPKPAR